LQAKELNGGKPRHPAAVIAAITGGQLCNFNLQQGDALGATRAGGFVVSYLKK